MLRKRKDISCGVVVNYRHTVRLTPAAFIAQTQLPMIPDMPPVLSALSALHSGIGSSTGRSSARVRARTHVTRYAHFGLPYARQQLIDVRMGRLTVKTLTNPPQSETYEGGARGRMSYGRMTYLVGLKRQLLLVQTTNRLSTRWKMKHKPLIY
jgi:hypothetical protein